jgi:C-methyltransferase
VNIVDNTTLSIAARSPQELLGLMSRFYVVSRSIHAIAELGIANHVGESPVSAPDVARAAGVSSEYLARCMRFLAAYGIFEETSPNWFRGTALSNLMRDDHPRSMRPVLRMVSSEWWDAAGRLPEVVRNGRSGIELGQGRSFFELLKEVPELQNRFSDGMSSISRMDDAALAGAYDFSGEGVVADIAGGEGNFLREVLLKNPRRNGLLFDQPQVLAESTLLAELAREGRARLVPGNLFEVLPAPADLYVLKGTLHDFADPQAIAILRNCASVLRPSDKLLIIEQVIPTGNVPHPNKTMDMVMMFLLGGKQRSLEEWSELLAQAGLRRGRVIPTPTPYTILEASLPGAP